MSDFRSDAQIDWSDRMKDSEGRKPNDAESLQDRIATMLDELPADKLDAVIVDHVDYEAFVSSQRAMVIAYFNRHNAFKESAKIDAEINFRILCKSHCNILLTALEKACKDK